MVGTQNRRILSGLLLSRLAAKNKTKMEMATNQNRGEKRPASNPAFIAANPDRVLWGSDWPHPNSNSYPGRKPSDIMPLYPIDDGRLLNQLPAWAPDPAIRKKILVDNPA